METVTFRSQYNKLMLSFPAERFGTGTNAKGEKADWPSIHFDYGMYQTKSEKLVEMLKEHIGNKANGGGDFWEEDRAVTAKVNLRQGDVVVVYKEKALDSDDLDAIEYLEKAAEKLVPTQAKNICKKIQHLQDKYQILGLPKPDPDQDVKRLKARIIEYLGALEDAGVIKNDRTGNTG